MRRLLYERDFYWLSPDGTRTADRPRELVPTSYQIVSYWQPRWRWLQRLLRWQPPYEF
jgi:hypothetical protein